MCPLPASSSHRPGLCYLLRTPSQWGPFGREFPSLLPATSWARATARVCVGAWGPSGVQQGSEVSVLWGHWHCSGSEVTILPETGSQPVMEVGRAGAGASGTRHLLANFFPMTLSCSLPATSISFPEPGNFSYTCKRQRRPLQRVTASLCYKEAMGLG